MNEYVLWGVSILIGLVITIITGYINRLIKELDDIKKDVENSKTKFTYEVSALKSRTKIVENPLI